LFSDFFSILQALSKVFVIILAVAEFNQEVSILQSKLFFIDKNHTDSSQLQLLFISHNNF
jgi:hypothetical protein